MLDRMKQLAFKVHEFNDQKETDTFQQFSYTEITTWVGVDSNWTSYGD